MIILLFTRNLVLLYNCFIKSQYDLKVFDVQRNDFIFNLEEVYAFNLYICHDMIYSAKFYSCFNSTRTNREII